MPARPVGSPACPRRHGPADLYNPEIGGKRIAFIGKWIHEFDVKNRFQGDLDMLSVALDF